VVAHDDRFALYVLLGMGARAGSSGGFSTVVLGLATARAGSRRWHPRQVHDDPLGAEPRALSAGHAGLSAASVSARLLDNGQRWSHLLRANPGLERSKRLGELETRQRSGRARRKRGRALAWPSQLPRH